MHLKKQTQYFQSEEQVGLHRSDTGAGGVLVVFWEVRVVSPAVDNNNVWTIPLGTTLCCIDRIVPDICG